MADSAATQAARYPLAAYQFKVVVGDVTMAVAEITGLERAFETLTYRHGFSAWEGETLLRYRMDRWQPVTLKKAVVSGAPALYEWLAGGGERTLSVSLCDHTGAAVVTWKSTKSVIVKIESPAFKADANEAAIETVSLMAFGIGIDHD